MDHDADEQPRTLLITLTGRDRPGVTATLTGALAAHDLEILDVEQVVIRGRLTLGVLVGPTVEHGSALVLDAAAATAREVAASLEMDADVVLGAAEHVPGRRGRLLVTVLGHPLLPSALSGITRRISALGGNIDRIVRTAAYPVTAIELSVSGADQQQLREALAVDSAALGVDAAVQRRGLAGRGTYVAVRDVGLTLLQDDGTDLQREETKRQGDPQEARHEAGLARDEHRHRVQIRGRRARAQRQDDLGERADDPSIQAAERLVTVDHWHRCEAPSGLGPLLLRHRRGGLTHACS